MTLVPRISFPIRVIRGLKFGRLKYRAAILLFFFESWTSLGSNTSLLARSMARMMNSIVDAAQLQAGPEAAAVPALLFQLHDDNPQMARVPVAQQLLFPSSPRMVCDEMGLHWQAAVRLQEEGWLSFSLEMTSQLDEAQEAELRFVGALVLAGCDRNMLGLLLGGLPRPYSYDLKRLYFDWATRCWRLLPDPQLHPEAAFTDWLDLLVRTRDVGSLVGIVELAQDAVSRVRGRS